MVVDDTSKYDRPLGGALPPAGIGDTPIHPGRHQGPTRELSHPNRTCFLFYPVCTGVVEA
jgi:hypothetical protein